MATGRVHAVRANLITVVSEGAKHVCTLRGKMRQARTRTTTLVSVGDFVEFTPQPASEGVIEKILERRTKLSRTETGRRRFEQIIVTNVDVLAAVHSVRDPDLSFSNIDRCTVMASTAGMAPAVIFNKSDLGEAPLDAYQELGMPTFATSAKTGAGVAELAAFVRGKTVALLGPSGAGKTSLLNALAPDLDLRTEEVSERTGEGTHTTSAARIHEAAGGLVADTPGLEFFTLEGVDCATLRDHFPEMSERGLTCAYTNCVHLTEPRCKVRAAVESGEIAPSRYESYRILYESLKSAPT